MSSTISQQDCVIVGGGIAGLWLLNRLKKQHKAACLIENKALGGIQSIASQGIIHGGTKYALTGQLSTAAKAIGEMPQRWHDCLQGKGDIDLQAVKVIADHQYLWSTGQIHSNISSFFASKMMKSRMTRLKKSAMPPIFQTDQFKGQLYQLNEKVLDPQSLMQVLINPVMDDCYHQNIIDIKKQPDGFVLYFADHSPMAAKQLILTAGQGNAALLKKMGIVQPKQQLRPLHMLMLKGDLPPITAHCLGSSTTPKVTITSGQQAGQTVWYLGGAIAEITNLSPSEQIKKGKACLAEHLPWVDISQCVWSSLKINRAEVQMQGKQRPNDIFIEKNDRLITAWPTKLVLAPRLADHILNFLTPMTDMSSTNIAESSQPPLADLPWQNTQWETF